LKIAESISYDKNRDEAFSEVAAFLARKGSEEAARNVAGKIADIPARVARLAFISRKFFKGDHDLFLEQMRSLLELAESIDLATSDIFFDKAFDKTNALIPVVAALVAVAMSGDQGTPEKQLALALAERAIKTARIIHDSHDRAMVFIRIAECLLDSKEKRRALDLLEHAAELATAIVDKRDETFPPVYPVWGIHILEELPSLFAEAGNVEKAREIMKQTIVAAKRIGSAGFGGRLIPEDIVRWQAWKGQPHLVKQVAMEILSEGEREASLWMAADGLLDQGQFEEALVLIDDGHLAPYRPRYEIMRVLTKAAVWLVRSKQFIRAQQVSERAIKQAQRAPSATLAAWLLARIADGLRRSQLSEIAHSVLDHALDVSRSIYRPHRWTHFQDYLEAFLAASRPDQARQLADWIVEMAELHRESMLENEDDGVREEWVTMLTAAGKAYAAAGDIYQAIAIINRFGDMYRKGRRYLYALGEIYREGRGKRAVQAVPRLLPILLPHYR
jgi:tetratricopeptide (TPR) repeat protein